MDNLKYLTSFKETLEQMQSRNNATNARIFLEGFNMPYSEVGKGAIINILTIFAGIKCKEQRDLCALT